MIKREEREDAPALRALIRGGTRAGAAVSGAPGSLEPPVAACPCRGGDALPRLPEGTITVLVTASAGSTRRWEQHTGAMQAALAPVCCYARASRATAATAARHGQPATAYVGSRSRAAS